MSGPNGKFPEINLDEFERHLRSDGGAPEAVEDPLAELTRLVDMISRDGEDDGAQAQKSGQPVAPNAGGAQPGERAAAARSLPRAPQYPAAPQAYPELDSPSLPHGERPGLLPLAAEARAEEGRGRGWRLKTVALAAVGVVLFGGAAAMKLGGVTPGSSKAPPFIAAAEGPTKIQPPNDATVQSPGDAGGLLTKDSTTSAPVKVVSNEEQPVDLHATAPSPSPDAAAPSPSPAGSSDASPVAPAPNTPIVAPAQSSATVAPLFPDAKPVKTVSVRPDGTLISADAGAPASPPPAEPAKTGIRVADNANSASDAAAQPATPDVNLPTKLSPPKSSARVAKTDTTAPTDATDTTPKPPASAKPANRAAKAAGDQVASAAAEAPAANDKAGGGDWVVQLAAPRSEADAQHEAARLKKKFADALSGADIGVHQADIKGETVYRVRATGYSRADAAALCSKLKASGGDCFITRN